MDFEFDIGYVFIGVVIGILIIGFFANRQPSFNPKPPLPQVTGDMTYQQLKQYNGEKKQNILIALKGIIYDVSSSDFYKKGAAYSHFAGHDASINLANMSHEQEKLNKWGIINLDQEKTQILNDWEKTYKQKYRVVGKVITQ